MKMDWSKLLSPDRLRPKEIPDTENGRSNFEKDLDRIVFCSSFRRLGKKTQVYPLAENDNVHTRLVHSLEVANVGRALGRLCAYKIRNRESCLCDNAIHRVSQIVQAACLAHDIGNPPFGHAGEYAIRAWFSAPENANFLKGLYSRQRDDLCCFDGNAQTFRILTKVEGRRPNEGMRLTCATLAATLKYPWTVDYVSDKKEPKFCVYQSEIDDLEEVANKVGLIRLRSNKFCRHPLAYLVEASDDICNRILDLEDACEMKLISFEEILTIFEPFFKDDEEYNAIINDNKLPHYYKVGYIRAKSIGYVINKVAITFDQLYDDIMNGELDCKFNLVSETKAIKEPIDAAQSKIKNQVFRRRRKAELETGAYSTLSTLLDIICRATKEMFEKGDSDDVSFKTERVKVLLADRVLKLEAKNLYDAYLIAIDYVAGMTDDYARFMAQQFMVQQNR